METISIFAKNQGSYKKNSVCSFKEMHTKICYGIKITYLDLLPNIRMKDEIAISFSENIFWRVPIGKNMEIRTIFIP